MVDINKTLITGDIECYARYTSTSTEYSEIVISSVEEEGYTFNGWVNKKGDSLEVDDDNKYHPRADGDEE